MKIIIASDSFKGSLSTIEAARFMEEGVRRILPQAEIVKIPIADGGEGTVTAMVEGLGGQYREKEVTGPLRERISAQYGILPDHSAVIEIAAACGLPLVAPENRNVMRATSFGAGELVLDALRQGCRKIYIGLGGSATNDCGVGLIQALGGFFLDKMANSISIGGRSLNRITKIDLRYLDPRLAETEIIAICDVQNPLCGPTGAAAIFAPQKGATPEQVKILDENAAHLAKVVTEQLQKDYANLPGAGAAGGLGFGLMAFANAKLQKGIDLMLDLCHFEQAIEHADLVITGEGKIDGQSAFGKVPVGIAARCAAKKIPVLAIAGSVGTDIAGLYEKGITAIYPAVCRPMPLQEAMEQAGPFTAQAAENALRLFLARQEKGC